MDRLRYLQDLKDETLNWSCLYAQSRSHPTCLNEATWHGLILTDDCTAVLHITACCDEHKKAMALSADFIHAFGSACGLPGSYCMWDGPSGVSYCYLPGELDASAIAEHAVGTVGA